MTYQDFRQRLLRALYDFTEQGGANYVKFSTLAETGGFELRPNWIDRFYQEMELSGEAQVSRHMGPHATWQARIRAAGAATVEEEMERDANWGLPQAAQSPEQPVVSSSAWTGRVTLPEKNRERLVIALRAAEGELDALGAGNAEKAQARAYLVAAAALAEAPDPPADIIWDLIQRANNIAGIAALLVSIVGLFVS